MTLDEFRSSIRSPIGRERDKRWQRITIEEGQAYMFYDGEIWVVGRSEEHAKDLTIIMIESSGVIDTMPVSKCFTLPSYICKRM